MSTNIKVHQVPELDTPERIEFDKVVRAFPDLVTLLLEAGYRPIISHHKTAKEGRFCCEFARRIYHEADNGEQKRAYTISVAVWDFREFKTMFICPYGLEWSATMDSAGHDQCEVIFGQNANHVNIPEAEDRFTRVFRGLGSPFYNG